MYRSPVSASRTTIVFPADSSRPAIWSARGEGGPGGDAGEDPLFGGESPREP